MYSNDPLYFAVNPQESDFQIPFSTQDPPKARDFSSTHLFVCDPPRERLSTATDETWALGIDSRLAIVRDDPDLDTIGFYSNIYAHLDNTTARSAPFNQEDIEGMQTKRRRSVQSILVPAFLQGSSSTPTSPDAKSADSNATGSKRASRIRAHSSAAAVSGRWSILPAPKEEEPIPSPLSPIDAQTVIPSSRDSPPPDFLLDDDPFADLTAGPSISRHHAPPPTSPPPPPEEIILPPTPRSPLMPTVDEVPKKSLTRANSSGASEKKSPIPRAFTPRTPVAAHQRPAFSSRPSLPSLSTLSQMHVVLTKKVRKGRPGAGLPFEPWDNPSAELPPRVLQDIHGASTQCLPVGTQPLLPSQLVGIATNASAMGNEAETPSHTCVTPASHSSLSVSHHEVSSTPTPIPSEDTPQWTPEHLNQSRSEPALPSTSSSESGHGDLLDSYYSEGSSEGHEEGGHSTAFDLDDESLSAYQRYQRYAEFTDFDTDTTTTASNSCDELSPPPSSRVSSFDLEPPHILSRSISSTSSRLSDASSSKSSSGHEDETLLGVDALPPSRSSAVIALEDQLRISFDSGINPSTRSSMEDSDSLRSPNHIDFDFLPPVVTSPDSYPFYPQPEVFPSTPALTSPSSPSGGVHQRTSRSSTMSSALRTPASYSPSSYFPPFPPSGKQYQAEADLGSKDFVAKWRDRYARMDSFGAGSGTYLSDLELSDPFLDLRSSSSQSSHDQANQGPPMEERELAPVAQSFVPSFLPETQDSLSHRPSHLTDIPSPRRNDELFRPFYPSRTSAVLAAEGSWPSSADTIRPLGTPRPATAFDQATHGDLGRENCGGDTLGVAGAGDRINSNIDEFDGVAIESRIGGAVMEPVAHVNLTQTASVPCEAPHSSAQDSAEDPFELERHPLGASTSSFNSAISSSPSASVSLSASTSTSHSAHSNTSSYISSSSSGSATSSVYKEHLHDEDCGDMRRYRTQWDGYSYDGVARNVVTGDGSGRRAVEGSGRDGDYKTHGKSYSGSYQRDQGTGVNGWNGATGGRHNDSTSAWGINGGRGDDDEEDDRRRRHLHRGPEPLAFSTPGRDSSSESEDDYGVPPPTAAAPTSPSRAPHTQHHLPSHLSSPRQPNLRSFPVSSTTTSSDDDDDVPLAQRIPTALTAQKSIRRQVREERHQKKLERAATTASRVNGGSREHRSDYDRRLGEAPTMSAAFGRDRHETLRPAGAGGPISPPPLPLSSSLEAALAAAGVAPPVSAPLPSTSQHPQQHVRQGSIPGSRATRARANTLHSRPSTAQTLSQNPFSAEDLATRLQNVQLAGEHHQGLGSASGSGPSSFGMRGHTSGAVTGGRTSFDNPEWSARGRTSRDPPTTGAALPNPPTSAQSLRPMRSFHREKRSGADEWGTAQAPALPSEAEQKIALQRQMSRSQSRARHEEPLTVSTRKRSVSVSRGPPSPRAYGHDDPFAPPVPPLPVGASRDEASHPSRKLYKAPPSGRTSTEIDRGAGLGKSPNAPMTALPSGPVVQQRFFVGDMQRFNMVEITSATTAGDVVEAIEAQGGFKGITGSGGWMVFEVAQDFGMERPIRSFELLSDVQASWNKDKMVNLFVLKLTPLAAPLSRGAIPSSSPIYSGYVEWEQKRGKWSKRFMQLREHSLWLSKREGKEQVLLCSLSNFDAYIVNRNHRAPKPFAFSVKSTDSLTFFENASDYVHNLACNEREGKVWMEKILVARSYVLHQERQILFNPKAAGGNASGAAVSRAGTLARKPTTRRPVEAPLVSVPPLVFSDQVQRSQPFEPGSLLHKQMS